MIKTMSFGKLRVFSSTPGTGRTHFTQGLANWWLVGLVALEWCHHIPPIEVMTGGWLFTILIHMVVSIVMGLPQVMDGL